ncbi:MAG: hypothetical protein ACRDSR_10575 [Pseudonocardiaceae bacterium]
MSQHLASLRLHFGQELITTITSFIKHYNKLHTVCLDQAKLADAIFFEEASTQSIAFIEK